MDIQKPSELLVCYYYCCGFSLDCSALQVTVEAEAPEFCGGLRGFSDYHYFHC